MRVVVVDDEKKMRDEITDYLKTFEKEQKVSVIAHSSETRSRIWEIHMLPSSRLIE